MCGTSSARDRIFSIHLAQIHSMLAGTALALPEHADDDGAEGIERRAPHTRAIKEGTRPAMSQTMVLKAATMLFMTAAVTGCTKTHLTFEKPGIAAADLQRDQNECLGKAMVDEGGSLLIRTVDREALIRCMETRGYRVARQ